MKILMHVCCANCSLYPIQTLNQRGFDISGFWFNPNIHPYTEYRARLNALKILQREWRLDVEYADDYGLKEFIRAVVNSEDSRCTYCYTVRLEETARKARYLGMQAFTTSLLVSPYQRTDLISAAGKKCAEKYNIDFIDEDFSVGYSEGVRMSKALGLYRQKYCGCIYSEMERYVGGKNEYAS